MKKIHRIVSLKQLIISKLILHIVIAAVCIFAANFLLRAFWFPFYLDQRDPFHPNPIFFQTDLREYQSLPEDALVASVTSLQVLNNQLQVIDSRNSTVQPGYQYSIDEFTDLLATEQEKNMLRANKFVNSEGESVIVILQQQLDEDLFDLLQQNAFNCALLSVIMSGLIILAVCISFIRSVYHPLQTNLRLISSSIAKTPHDPSRVDTSQLSLLETQSVLQVYNTMLDEMEQTKKEKDRLEEQSHRLISNLSHDLKSPMTNLRGYAELLAQEHLTPTEQTKYLNQIHSNILALNSMVELLSEQVKYQYNDYPLHLERKDMNDFLREICANYYTIFEKQGFTMEIDIMDDPYYMEFDRMNMRRVYSNLLENILSHNQTPTQIQIKTIVQEDCYLVQIKDNGIGITSENQDKIFEPFYQGDESRTKQHSGLGLFVVKQILEKHQATITLEQEPDYQTIFTIHFPAQPQNDEQLSI